MNSILSNEYDEVIDFEKIVTSKKEATLQRQYRDAYINYDDYWRVVNNKGEYSSFATSGSGYSQWYFYHTLDDRLVCVIKSFSSLSWQNQKPPEPKI